MQVDERVHRFLEQELPGAGAAGIRKLKGDASTREYFRCRVSESETAILTLYPEPFDPDESTYLQVYRLLCRIGLPVPRIHAVDGNLGVVLQEDLGDMTLERRLRGAGSRERKRLLGQAAEHLIVLQREGPQAADPGWPVLELAFDVEKLTWELQFFRRHFLEGYSSLHVEREKLASEFLALCVELAGAERFVCHRDYQVRNLMLKEERVYMIDFQDARLGPQAYDLVSLLMDSIDLPPGEVEELVDFYLGRGAPAVDAGRFRRQFHLATIQRLLKALGTFGYQAGALGRKAYRAYIPGTVGRVATALKTIPEFPYIRALVEEQVASAGRVSC